MSRFLSISFSILAVCLLAATSAAAAERPNVLIILADDMGYSDLGCYGSEIDTPNLDRLAQDGLRFTHFYNTARCWPTRGALMTGYYPQQIRRDTVPGMKRTGGSGVRPEWAPMLSARLKSAGYRSYHSGKWHLDGKSLDNGWDHSYRVEDAGRYFNPQNHFEDDKKLPPVERDADYYVTTAIADHAIRCLKEHAEQHSDKPFFQYVAFTAPHFPLHALPEDIAKYRERYQKGWEEVRKARLEKQHSLGIHDDPASEVERDIGPPYHFPEALEALGPGEVNRPIPWDELTEEQKKFQAEKMAIHAAMIDCMDREIGRVLDQLRAMNAFENTLIMFLSDNGASAEIMVRDDGHDRSAPLGSAATHACLGPGWSTVANTPFRRHKTWVHEGGVCTPMVVHWLKGIKARGELRTDPGHVVDVTPTVLELVGVEAKTKDDAPPLPGVSLAPAFEKEGALKRDYIWFLHEGNRALRVGDWKVVAARQKPWELYNLAEDRTESNNLAEKKPEKLKELVGKWESLSKEFFAQAMKDAPADQADAKPVKELILPGESFLIDGRPAFVFLPPPEKRSDPQPWVMYSPTLPGYPDKNEKWMHEQFLNAGVAVAGVDVGEGYGNEAGRTAFSRLYQHLVIQRGWSERPCMLARSRGGLWATSWVAEHPEKVSGLAGIYPVFDLTSYPGVEKASKAYGLTADELQQSLAEHNPIEKVSKLAEARVPAFIIHGDVDELVPLEPNSGEFVARYRSAGAGDAVELLVAEGQGHNLWEGFFRCQPLIDFAIARAKDGASIK